MTFSSVVGHTSVLLLYTSSKDFALPGSVVSHAFPPSVPTELRNAAGNKATRGMER